MKKFLILLLAAILLLGCVCGCSDTVEETQPQVTEESQPENKPLDHKPVGNKPTESESTEPVATQPLVTAPPPTQPSGAPQKPQSTQPPVIDSFTTEPQTTEPQETKPQETKPQKTTVPATGEIIKDLTCTISIDGGSEQVIENPTASDFYAYIRSARSQADRRNPSSEGSSGVIHFSFKIGEKEISWLDLYPDDYAAIPLTVELPTTQFYLFPSGTYQTIMNTLNK